MNSKKNIIIEENFCIKGIIEIMIFSVITVSYYVGIEAIKQRKYTINRYFQIFLMGIIVFQIMYCMIITYQWLDIIILIVNEYLYFKCERLGRLLKDLNIINPMHIVSV